jgi:hypothetical protein
MSLRLKIVAVLAGLISGMLGVGGGLVVGPSLILAGYSLRRATGTAVVVIPFVALASVLCELIFAPHNFLLLIPLLIFAGGLIGVSLGQKILRLLPPTTMHFLFLGLLILAAVKNIDSSLSHIAAPDVSAGLVVNNTRLAVVALAGVLAGICAVLFGIGGGIVVVPALVFAIDGMSFTQASALSLLAMVPVAGSAALKAIKQGRADLQLANKIIWICAPAAIVGVLLRNFSLSHQQLQLCFAVFLLYVALRMLRRGPIPGT